MYRELFWKMQFFRKLLLSIEKLIKPKISISMYEWRKKDDNMKYIIMPKKIKNDMVSCNGDCSNNCFGKCTRLGSCFCPWDR